jgi:hypothetical protein
MSIRAISAETGIPVGAVHRAKRQLEKGRSTEEQKAAAISRQPPTHYVVRQDINSVQQKIRRLTVSCASEPLRAQCAGHWGVATETNADAIASINRFWVWDPKRASLFGVE